MIGRLDVTDCEQYTQAHTSTHTQVRIHKHIHKYIHKHIHNSKFTPRVQSLSVTRP